MKKAIDIVIGIPFLYLAPISKRFAIGLRINDKELLVIYDDYLLDFDEANPYPIIAFHEPVIDWFEESTESNTEQPVTVCTSHTYVDKQLFLSSYRACEKCGKEE